MSNCLTDLWMWSVRFSTGLTCMSKLIAPNISRIINSITFVTSIRRMSKRHWVEILGLTIKRGSTDFLDEVRGLDVEEFEEVHSDDFKARMREPCQTGPNDPTAPQSTMFLNWIREQKIPHSAKIKLPKERRINARPLSS